MLFYSFISFRWWCTSARWWRMCLSYLVLCRPLWSNWRHALMQSTAFPPHMLWPPLPSSSVFYSVRHQGYRWVLVTLWQTQHRNVLGSDRRRNVNISHRLSMVVVPATRRLRVPHHVVPHPYDHNSPAFGTGCAHRLCFTTVIICSDIQPLWG